MLMFHLRSEASEVRCVLPIAMMGWRSSRRRAHESEYCNVFFPSARHGVLNLGGRMMAGQYANRCCVREPNVSLSCSAANEHDTTKRTDRLNDCIEVHKAKFDIARERSANAAAVLIPQIPRNDVPYGNLVAPDAGALQLRTKVRGCSVRIVERNASGLDRLRSRRFENEEIPCEFVAILRVEPRHLILKALLATDALDQVGQGTCWHEGYCSS